MSKSALRTRCVSSQLKALTRFPIQNFPVVGMETTRHVIYYPSGSYNVCHLAHLALQFVRMRSYPWYWAQIIYGWEKVGPWLVR
jgi:hypothetical protein